MWQKVTCSPRPPTMSLRLRHTDLRVWSFPQSSKSVQRFWSHGARNLATPITLAISFTTVQAVMFMFFNQAKKSCYRTVNALFGEVDRIAIELVVIQSIRRVWWSYFMVWNERVLLKDSYLGPSNIELINEYRHFCLPVTEWKLSYEN